MPEGFHPEVFRGGNTARKISYDNSVLIDKNLCERIEHAHYNYNSSANVENLFIDAHKNDVNGNVISSPVFQEYHKQTVAAMTEYEELKKELVDRYNLYDYDWRLSFKDCKVILE